MYNFVNFVSFSDVSDSWNEGLVPVNKENTLSALQWIERLNSEGSTNYLEGLRKIYQDKNLQSIYLLTDGCPTDVLFYIFKLFNLHIV
jgi:hypothetical protein